jgi:crossover junction endodeoxyribonuclease RuvC
MQHPVRILGIDPGLRHCGWGLVESLGNQLSFVAAGTIKTKTTADLAQRLCELHEGLSKIVSDFSPEEAAVENTFVNRDGAATLKLGQARGIALLVPAQAGLPVAEYAPNAVKKTVTGVGHGGKDQVQMMVKVLLPKAEFDSEHSADALAIAICHAQQRGRAALEKRLDAQLAKAV